MTDDSIRHFFIKVAGTKSYQDAVKCVSVREFLACVPEPENPYDEDAVALYHDKQLVGYVPRDYNSGIAGRINNGFTVLAYVTSKHGGTRGKPTIGLATAIIIADPEVSYARIKRYAFKNIELLPNSNEDDGFSDNDNHQPGIISQGCGLGCALLLAGFVLYSTLVFLRWYFR